MRLETGSNFGVREAYAQEPDRHQVIRQIKKGMFTSCPEKFMQSLLLSHHLPMLTVYSPKELAALEIFKLIDHHIGFALKPSGAGKEIVGVHNNAPGIHGIGSHLVRAAIDRGGNHLNHFGHPKLNDLYQGVGLLETHRVNYDPAYDPEGKFFQTYGPLPVIYRQLVD